MIITYPMYINKTIIQVRGIEVPKQIFISKILRITQLEN